MRMLEIRPVVMTALSALLALFVAPEVRAADRVAVVYSAERSAFTSCAKELASTLSGSESRPIVKEFVVSGSDSAVGDVNAFSPDVIAAVGSAGVQWAKKNAGTTRVVSCLTLDPLEGAPSTWTATSMRVSAKDRLSLIAEALSKDVSCGVLYGAEQSGAFVAELETAAAELEMKLTTIEVRSKKGIGKALTRLRKDGCDVVVGLADGTVYAGAQVLMILKYCHKYRLAFVGISEAFAKAGAVMAFYTNPEDQGAQAAQLVLSVLEKNTAKSEPPRPVRIAVNKKVARLIRADLSDDFVDKADKTYE